MRARIAPQGLLGFTPVIGPFVVVTERVGVRQPFSIPHGVSGIPSIDWAKLTDAVRDRTGGEVALGEVDAGDDGGGVLHLRLPGGRPGIGVGGL